jgi:hypothetical protein
LGVALLAGVLERGLRVAEVALPREASRRARLDEAISAARRRSASF